MAERKVPPMPKVEIFHEGKQESVTAEAGALLSDVLNLDEHRIDLPCGGAGTCLRCRVKASGHLSAPDKTEEELFGPVGLAEGWRLACQSRITGDAEIRLERPGKIGQIMAGITRDEAAAAPLYKRAGVAVDIGTTTMAAVLFSTEDDPGAPAPAWTLQNPQTRFGADVITRIELALKGQGDALRDAVQEGVLELVRALAKQSGRPLSDIDALLLTGNTAMLYLLTGTNPEALSHYPFEADRLFGETLPAETFFPGSDLAAQVYLPRCISAFVGADITTAILSTGLCNEASPALLIDIGTNGEIALWDGHRLLCCSTAAGPSFEGVGIENGVYAVSGAVDTVHMEDGRITCTTIGDASPCGICGSGIVDVMAMMLKEGIVDETGAFQAEGHAYTAHVEQVRGQNALRLCENVVFTAEDVRKVQLAKGSIRAGIETLLIHAEMSAGTLGKFFIAGGFGNYLNLESAAAIGLIPEILRDRTQTVGNAALNGAGMVMQDAAKIPVAEKIAQSATTVDLGANPVFQEQYMMHMMFEESE